MKTIHFFRMAIAAVLILPAACASSRPVRPVDPELSSLSQSGRSAFARGEYKLAVRFYRLARQRARVIDHPEEIGAIAYNLAASYLELGETGRAAELLEESRRTVPRDFAVPTDLIILQGRVALLQGRPAEAVMFIEEGLAGGEKALDPADRIQFQLLRGRAVIAAGDPETAETIVTGLAEPMKKVKDDILQADYAALGGELLFLQGNFPEAGQAFDREAERLRRAARYRGMTRARIRAGGAYLEAGDHCRAGESFYRAGRALAARGETVAALEMIRSTLAAAEVCPEEILRDEAAALFLELQEALAGTATAPDE